MEKLSKYKKQIFTLITIFLLLEFGVYPCLTMANTFANIVGAIALLILVLWAGVSLYEYVKNSDGLIDVNELKESQKVYDEKTKPKRKPKVTKSEFPIESHSKTVKKSVTKKTK